MEMDTKMETALHQRAKGQCELCESREGLAPLEVPPQPGNSVDGVVLLCDRCQTESTAQALDPARWFCLNQSIWSEVPAVQVLSYRMLQRLQGEGWARDLLDQAYLEDSVLAWANAVPVALGASAGDSVNTVDSNGTNLAEGDTVTLIKNLEVKGANFTAKRGTVVKNIRLTDNPEHVEGRINGSVIVLKTCFLKKQ